MATSGTVKLLGTWASPFLYRVQIALNLKSISYEYIEQNLGSKSELLLKSNPVHKKVPVFIHDDKPISESLIIVQYIDEIWTNGPSILPSEPYDRALARFWAAYIDDKWFPLLREFRTAQGEEAKAAVKERMDECFLLLEAAFEECSKGKAYFGGDAIGYIDIALGSFLTWLKVVEITADMKLLDKTKTPGLFEWADRFVSNDAVKDVFPETERLVELMKIFLARAKTSSK